MADLVQSPALSHEKPSVGVQVLVSVHHSLLDGMVGLSLNQLDQVALRGKLFAIGRELVHVGLAMAGVRLQVVSR